jgi:hypothetical protein
MSYERLKSPQITGQWADGAIVTNPGSAAVLETTGALPDGDYFFSFLLTSDADAVFQIAHRDSTDSSDVHVKDIPVPTNTMVEVIFPTKLTLALYERLSVRNKTSFTGNAQATIFLSLITG